jgi:type IV pilus assembly protein PilQ
MNGPAWRTALPRTTARYVAAAILGCTSLLCSTAFAAQVESLAWEGDTGPVLQIRVTGDTSYTTTSLEGGQRLRITFPNSTLGPSASELERRGKVKGVYPYLADNGAAVNVDLLLTEPGWLNVEKIDSGYRVTALPGAQAPATPAAAPAPAAPAAKTSTASGEPVLEEIRHATLPGDRVQITLKMSGPPPTPNTFSITNPPRVALDFPNTHVNLANKNVRVASGAVLNVTAIEAGNRTRVVLSLVRPVAYKTSVKGNEFAILVETPVRAIGPAETRQSTRFAAAKQTGKFKLSDIDFRRGPQGDGQVKVSRPQGAGGANRRRFSQYRRAARVTASSRCGRFCHTSADHRCI